ncbi:MAG: YHYH protein [Gemmatimonadaceae bacterium]
MSTTSYSVHRPSRITLLRVFYAAASAVLLACGANSTSSTSPTEAMVSVASVVTASYKSAVTISTSGSSLVLRSEGIPDHVTPYWGVGKPLYEAQIAGHHVTPGSLMSQTFVMTIPASPAKASNPEETSLGPIGMALNGVAIYNDREGGNVPLEVGVLQSFDRAGAHSGPGGLYHYHADGDFTSKDDAKLIGFLRDGFPIYGRKDAGGAYPTDLDANGGHTGTTADFPTAIYHYHTSRVNYLNGGYYVLKAGSYHGTKGTFSS